MVDASATADRAKEQMQDKAQVAQEKVQETADTMRTRVREQVDQRSTHAGGQVRSTAQALRSTSERLREDGQDGPAKAAERAADQAEKVGGWLERSDADRILQDVEDFGRRQPMAVVAIGLAAGFAASRFLKASSRNRYTQGGGTGFNGSSQQRPAAIQPQSTGPVIPTHAGETIPAGTNGLS
jgi:arginine utilization protein RocB